MVGYTKRGFCGYAMRDCHDEWLSLSVSFALRFLFANDPQVIGELSCLGGGDSSDILSRWG